MVSVFVSFINQIYSLLAFVLTEQVHILIFVTSGNQLFQSKKFKVVSKIGEEIADTWVITITQYCFTTEMFTVMLQFVVYIFKLRIKLVLFRFFSLIQILIRHIVLRHYYD